MGSLSAQPPPHPQSLTWLSGTVAALIALPPHSSHSCSGRAEFSWDRRALHLVRSQGWAGLGAAEEGAAGHRRKEKAGIWKDHISDPG